MRVRGRFAPTPSGQLHIGNACTALLSWLQVQATGGAFVLRMEDLDRTRSRPDVAQQILDDLRWLGLEWDEGPDVGGPYGPYAQSDRTALYEAALQALSEAGWLYPCFCSRADILTIASAPHGLSAEGPSYPGRCRTLSPAERRNRAAGGKMPSLRFALPDADVVFVDGVAGPLRFPPGAGGDFVVKRADGIISYQLAVVVDDAAMGITHVLRGSDLLDSTPRQIWLHKALGLPVPAFAHVPLLLGSDGQRLSKRHGSVAVATLRANGVAPERVIGHLAFVSGLIDRPEPAKAADLRTIFDLDRIPHHPVVITNEQLAAFAEH